jgi:hypothetical protein
VSSPHPVDGSGECLITQMGITLSALHVPVPESATDQQEVLGSLVKKGPKGMPKGMDREGLMKPGAAQPERKPILHPSG